MSKGNLKIKGELTQADSPVSFPLRLDRQVNEWIDNNTICSKNTAINYLCKYAIGEIDEELLSGENFEDDL